MLQECLHFSLVPKFHGVFLGRQLDDWQRWPCIMHGAAKDDLDNFFDQLDINDESFDNVVIQMMILNSRRVFGCLP
jgi:hypothetical protein